MRHCLRVLGVFSNHSFPWRTWWTRARRTKRWIGKMSRNKKTSVCEAQKLHMRCTNKTAQVHCTDFHNQLGLKSEFGQLGPTHTHTHQPARWTEQVEINYAHKRGAANRNCGGLLPFIYLIYTFSLGILHLSLWRTPEFVVLSVNPFLFRDQIYMSLWMNEWVIKDQEASPGKQHG